MIRLATLVGLAGLALATALFVWHGIGSVLGAFAAAGFGILGASLFHLVPMSLNARAWQILLPHRGRSSLILFLGAVWVREAVNGLLPVARIGGEVVSARLLVRHGLRPATAVASLVLDMSLSLLSQFAFTLLGLVLLLLHGAKGGVIRDIALGLAATAPLMGVLLGLQHAGAFTLLAKLFRTIFGRRFDKLVGGAAPLDRAVRRLYRRRAPVFLCFVWQLAGWAAGAGEVWLALFFLGAPATLPEAVAIEAVIQALSSSAFIVPSALGIQEAGFLVVGGLFGIAPELSLALALARRARDVIIFVPALVLWQVRVSQQALYRA